MSDRLSATVELLDGTAFRAASGSGHSLVLEAAPSTAPDAGGAAPRTGGAGRGPTPMEMLLMGLAGCTGMGVIGVLRKMRQEVSGYQVRVVGECAADHPRVFTTIHVEHVVRGRGLRLEAIGRAVELSATRYCPAAAMLGGVARIEERYRAVDDVSGEERVGALAPAVGQRGADGRQ